MTAPKTGTVAPETGTVAPKTGSVAPKTGTATPKTELGKLTRGQKAETAADMNLVAIASM